MGIQHLPNIGRFNESALWANSRASIRGYHVSECGDLTGLHGLRKGLGLDITPYATGKYRREYDAKDSDFLGIWFRCPLPAHTQPVRPC
ncbi:MAG: hypothetical protein Ct9H300mP7_3860 [Verrucomicrobiota bacterium]|nr:MAG: hypothetical protein Ct9H300mP7_3860 [Verrucomicrobiota bacterium]